MTSRSSSTGVLVAVAALLCARPGFGKAAGRHPSKRMCTGAYQEAANQEQQNHLRRAKTLLGACAKAACGAFLFRQCKLRRAPLGLGIPPPLPLLTDERGQPPTHAPATMDGQPPMSRLDRRAAPLDPG